MTEPNELLRASDMARLLGVTRSRVYQLVRAGEIPAVRIGGALRIPRGAWEKWLGRQADAAINSTKEPMPVRAGGLGEKR